MTLVIQKPAQNTIELRPKAGGYQLPKNLNHFYMDNSDDEWPRTLVSEKNEKAVMCAKAIISISIK